MENQQNQLEDTLKKIYYDSKNPGSFGGRERLYLEAKKYHSNVKRKDIENWLKGEIVYTLHRQARRKFKRNPILSEFPYENFQADLVDMQEFSKVNNGYRFILTVIDVFTKLAWASPLKDKSKNSVTNAFKEIIENNKPPAKLMTDKGKEFDNHIFANLMNKYGINHYMSENIDIKCSIIERFNRTLKNRMFKFFTLSGIRRYIDELQNFLWSYNNAKHRSIKMSPIEASLEQNQKVVFKNLYGLENKREFLKKYKKPKLLPGTNVRKKYNLKIMDRGYYPVWSDQTFEVLKGLSGNIKPYYKLKDSTGNIIKKRFYPEEIQDIKVKSYRIEKILKERTRKGRKEFLIKWLNYPSTENSWIPAENVTSVNG